jgi:tetrahydromethanopterin S-methyltransferase subunit F
MLEFGNQRQLPTAASSQIAQFAPTTDRLGDSVGLFTRAARISSGVRAIIGIG